MTAYCQPLPEHLVALDDTATLCSGDFLLCGAGQWHEVAADTIDGLWLGFRVGEVRRWLPDMGSAWRSAPPSPAERDLAAARMARSLRRAGAAPLPESASTGFVLG